jgi:hypothetical protein
MFIANVWRGRWTVLWTLLMGLLLNATLYAQPETECDPTEGLPVATGDVFFNYGSTTNAFSFQNRSDLSIGQPLIGRALSQRNASEYGFWARFLLPPQSPRLIATQGDFPDRILLRWSEDPLSATSSSGYIIKRDGAFLAELEPGTAQFIDFNVQPGEFYEYSIQGVNRFGQGVPGLSVGFINPNGTVTGRITTRNGNPVAGATVTLSPTMGRSLVFDGVDDYVCLSYDERLNTQDFALTAWIRVEAGQDQAVIIDRGRDLAKNYWLTTNEGGEGAGAIVGVGGNGQRQEIAVSFDEDPNGWHHIAAIYAGGKLLVYVDGEFRASRSAVLETEAALFHFGMGRDGSTPFRGGLDEIRIYDRYLTQTELLQTKDITASSTTPGLVAYWKCDEGIGGKIFDTAGGDIDGTLEEADFDPNTPELLNAGITDEGGYYIIEGVNYSQTESFKAKPSQNFYDHASVEFNVALESSATLPAVNLPDSATVDIAFQAFSLQGRQSILSRGSGDDFELYLENNQLYLKLNQEAQLLGTVNSEYQYMSLTLDEISGAVQYYRNGNLENTLSYGSPVPPETMDPWHLGARQGADYFTGLIGEVAFFNTVLPEPRLQIHASNLSGEDIESGVDAGDARLLAYFPMDEGAGSVLEDYGPNQLSDGQLFNASFSIIAYRQVITPHVYRPGERIVNLNGSVTAVGNIDFVDESTVPITGVVRFSETFCYQDSVELLVNGNRYFPRIFTDENGRFSADFEPGANVILTPTFVDTTHLFSPPFFEVRSLRRPIAGVLFQNTTKREIEGIVAGGLCQLSINDTDDPLTLTVASLNGCYEKQVDVTAASGRYLIRGLPPIPMRVSVSRHFDPNIYDFFQVAGGEETDLRQQERDTINFIYTAPPNVLIEPFRQNPDCPDLPPYIQQSTQTNGFREYQTDIQVYEDYLGGRCFLDSFALEVTNDIADSPLDTFVSDSVVLPLRYFAGIPNFAGNREKLLNVVARNASGSSEATASVVVLGERSLENTFITTAPNMPLFVLRDPPGDKSSATLSRGTKVCRTFKEATFLSANQNIIKEVDAGPKIVTYAGSPFGGVITTIEQTAETAFEIGLQEKIAQSHELEWCTTLNTTYTTSSGDDLLYEDADIFVGAAINLEISSTERLSVDPDNCSFTESRGNRILPTEIGTDYVYSRWQIETDVIPSLLENGDTSSARSWERILVEEGRAKANATLKRNYSFDGIASVSESETISKDTDNGYQFDLTVTEDLKTVVGTEVGDVGTTISLALAFGQGLTIGGSESESESTTVQYTLADDDPNDNFTVDILEDGVYNTPVFLLRAGESMCPWEPGTRNREQVGFNIDKLSEINVPENEAAVFRLQLTNEGQTGNDALIYTLGVVEDSNPDGAVIQVNGSSLNSPRSFQILPDEELELLLSVKKGAGDIFNYPDLGIFMSSKCMLDHSRSVGYDLSNTTPEIDPDTGEEITTEGPYEREDLAKFYKEFRLNVEFVEPCTPIDISFPRQDWVVTPADNERLSVTLTGYNNEDPDLDTIRLQYRPTGGDGSWINIQELGAAEFANDPVSKVLQWNMEELRDGPYDIRATAVCKDLNLEPGISEVVRGRKETQPPRLLGTPQPADGVLNPGDEISITFTKRIQCDLIFQADGIGTNININNLALIDKTTGELVDATISCRDDKIVIVPNVANQFIENRTLGVVVNDIQDFYGNPSDSIFWEFLVNRSNLYWDGGRIDEVTPEGETLTVTREIRNQSGAITSFNIPSVPDWVQVFPRSGTLAPGARQVINFVFPSDLLADTYSTEIIMLTVDGEEPLTVDLRVACEGPPWFVNPGDFSTSMNLTVELDIEGELSEDRLDQIGAFIGDELRGVANIQRLDPLATGPGNNPYLAFLTVYGNEVDEGTVTFQIWDASDCNLYGETLESFPFRPDTVIGEPLQPQTIHTSGLLLKTIRLNEGWNWISYNLALPDSSVDATMATLTQADETSILKGQSQFSQFTPGPDRWFGSLTETTTLSMFQYRSPALDSLRLLGRVVDPSTAINLVAGWNWIGYLPNQGLPVNSALQKLADDEVLRNGDVIKSQTTFAQYVAGLGWLRNLMFLISPKGYQIRNSEDATQVDPDPGSSLLPVDLALGKRLDSVAYHWSVNPADFEFSMNLVAVIADAEGRLVLAEGDEIGAFAGTEPRGVERVLYLPELDASLVFLTVFGQQDAEEITFRYFDQSEDREYMLVDTLRFATNQVLGEVMKPTVLSLDGTTSLDGEDELVGSSFTVYPNPASGLVYFDFSARANEVLLLTVRDPLGREVDRVKLDNPTTRNRLEWNVRNLPAGVYLVTLEQGGHRRSLRLSIK